jgi:hypothetical protein
MKSVQRFKQAAKAQRKQGCKSGKVTVALSERIGTGTTLVQYPFDWNMLSTPERVSTLHNFNINDTKWLEYRRRRQQI